MTSFYAAPLPPVERPEEVRGGRRTTTAMAPYCSTYLAREGEGAGIPPVLLQYGQELRGKCKGIHSLAGNVGRHPGGWPRDKAATPVLGE